MGCVVGPFAAMRAASSLIVRVLSAMPYSFNTRSKAPNVVLDRVDPDVEELAMHPGHEMGRVEHEHLVAALERRPAEVVGGEVLVLHPGAERTVEHEDPLGERVEKADIEARLPGPLCRAPLE